MQFVMAFSIKVHFYIAMADSRLEVSQVGRQRGSPGNSPSWHPLRPSAGVVAGEETQLKSSSFRLPKNNALGTSSIPRFQPTVLTESAGPFRPSVFAARGTNHTNTQGAASSSFPASSHATESPANQKLRVVEIDGLVLAKIIKHCRDNYPTTVSGKLLGTDVNDKLEVTNCFPLPQKKDLNTALQREKAATPEEIDEKVEEEYEKYQEKMSELMHDVNVDCFAVGWYQTLTYSDFQNKETIDALVQYQGTNDKAILLGYDPLLNATGRMAFKAYRASEKFRSIYYSHEGDSSKFNKLSGKDILVEVPISIKIAPLLESYLLEWGIGQSLQDQGDFDAFELDHNSYLEKNLSVLSNTLDAMMEEQEKLQKYQREHVKQQFTQKQLQERHKLENEQRQLRGEAPLPMEYSGPAFRHIEPPSQINSLLMCNQAALQCKEINTTCAESLAKTFLLVKGNTKHLSG
ncbi:putative eukaryotic initiation factor-3, subunit 3 [Cardiosporidium cionae]|uniref:Eukaryotic translation initiation factor 3 subunit H n=1 Tax=Cardiosporidium cionae TaxID=476202 RepID=A0ABQ7JAK6_9APIC|nr:putative eukaryotic initiation factor-3, subunit 3 [Cardiosporidium cionae]|eukprot:KAF8821037.1 putative eukaryotic initiation factor-3, subunit 3 [Cardiosporidium cionae]